MKLLFCFGKNIKTSQTITPSVSLQLTAPSDREPTSPPRRGGWHFTKENVSPFVLLFQAATPSARKHYILYNIA